MKRTHLNALIDGLAFVAFLFVLSTGLLLEYQLPVGSGGLQSYGSVMAHPAGRFNWFGAGRATSGVGSTIGLRSR